MRLRAHSFPNYIRRCPQTNDQRVLLEAAQMLRICADASSSRDDCSPQFLQFGNDFPFRVAKNAFAAVGKNVGNSLTGAALDHLVGVNEVEVQLRGNQPAYGRLSSPHEA